MQGVDVFNVLKRKYIHNIYHANTVTTSCTFLQLGGLASRGLGVDLELPQTPQSSDEIDRECGIWYDVFTDTVDIHERARRPNEYGPVLFKLPVDILNSLPEHSEVLITKCNPIYWHNISPDKWFFESIEDLERGLIKGEFAQMIVIRTPKGILPFPKGQVSIIIDDPQRNLSSRVTAYKHAISKIQPAANKLSIPTKKRVCGYGCKCVEKYLAFGKSDFERYFS